MSVHSQQVGNCQLDPWRDLTGTIVMVTGASSGIGWEFCVDLAKAGCRIIAAARRTDRLKSLCDKINNLEYTPDGRVNGSEARKGSVIAVAVELDVSGDGPDVEASVRKAWEVFGRIDALINNAGVKGPVRSALDLSEEDWDQTYRTNIRGTWLVSKYVCKRMIAFNRDRGGSIINISSIAGLNSVHVHGAVAYISSKSALNTMTKVMAMELGKNKIRVNSICPGLFKSEITGTLLEKKWFKNVALKTAPLRDFGTTDPALTSLIRYLINDSSNYVTGNIFVVDSGYNLPGIPLYSSL